MLKNFRSDSIVSFLLERCSLTPAQLDTLMLSEAYDSLSEKASLRDRKKVSKGSFLRSLRQGQANVESSIYTLILLEYLGLVDSKQLLGLGRIGELISKVRGSSPSAESISNLLRAMEKFAEEFSRRRKDIGY